MGSTRILEMKLQIETKSSEDTEKLAEKIGRCLRGGEVIELVSDLGGGKTTFTRGLARGIGSEDRVASPTFTLSKVYKGKKLWLNHFDFYRLQEPGIIQHEIHDVIGDPNMVTVIEWADLVSHVLPENRLTICLKHTGDNTRELELEFPESLSYLTENLK